MPRVQAEPPQDAHHTQKRRVFSTACRKSARDGKTTRHPGMCEKKLSEFGLQLYRKSDRCSSVAVVCAAIPCPPQLLP